MAKKSAVFPTTSAALRAANDAADAYIRTLYPSWGQDELNRFTRETRRHLATALRGEFEGLSYLGLGTTVVTRVRGEVCVFIEAALEAAYDARPSKADTVGLHAVLDEIATIAWRTRHAAAIGESIVGGGV